MFQNYITIAVRNIFRHKTDSAITIVGLALGMACSILLVLQVHNELSFDAFHANKDRIFRIYTVAQQPNRGEDAFITQPVPLAPTLKAEMPQVQYATRLSSTAPASMKYNGSVFRESPVFVDEDFFTIFTVSFLQGSAANAFKELRSVVVTKEFADQAFGNDANALGKPLTIRLYGQDQSFLVSGVIADAPKNSSLEFAVLLRYEQQENYARDKNVWTNSSTETYVCLREHASAQEFERALQPFVDKNFAVNIKSQQDAGIKPNARGNYLELHAQPLSDVHLNTALDKSRASLTALYALVGIAVIIMLIAVINYVNLSVARSLTRSREVGIRKTMGAARGQIIVQFLGEALVTVMAALLLAVVLAEALLPLFNSIMRSNLTLVLEGGALPNILFWGALLLVLALVGVVAGAYPAFYVSRFAAVTAMKGRLQGISPSRLRSVLVVVQFALAVGLIACTMIIRQQTEFMQNRSLGFNRAGVVMIPTGDGANGKAIMENLRAVLARNPVTAANIVAMSTGTKAIGRGLDNSNTTSHITRNFNGGRVSVDVLNIDYNYLETLEIPMLAGRTFNKAHMGVDTSESIIVNEAAARQIWNLLRPDERKKLSGTGEFSAQATVGVMLPPEEQGALPMVVVGVTADYHVESLRRKIAPTIHVMWSDFPATYIFVRLRGEEMISTMAALQAAWQEVSPDVPWQGSFLDDNIARLYRNYTRQTRLTMTAASIAIALACVGLFALAAMMIRSRTKEIGIRKVLGASVASIIGLLSKDFVRLVVVGIVVAVPVAWWLMSRWLQDFAYRVELSAWVFVAAGVVAVAIALVTVAAQAFRAARANPVNALRSE
jgi:ABC-type antimicrobial peptide transport system permease subunit